MQDRLNIRTATKESFVSVPEQNGIPPITGIVE